MVMKQVMYSVNEVSDLINNGKKLIIAADASLLAKLPKGEWIGGSTQYFMSENGGLTTTDKAMVTFLPDFIVRTKIISYTLNTIQNVYTDAFEKGFSVIIIPASSQMHLSFALNAHHYNDFAIKPLMGWISGIALSEIGNKSAMVFSNSGMNSFTNEAVVMHVELPSNKFAEIDIINVFYQGSGDTITFLEDSFSVTDALINDEKQNLANYITSKNIDIRLPLVAKYSGSMINVSFQSVSDEKVVFYAPVFKGISYKIAKTMDDDFKNTSFPAPQISNTELIYACNCILNYLHFYLEGKKTANITGPITFGEIAYQLLNQTMVYLKIGDL